MTEFNDRKDEMKLRSLILAAPLLLSSCAGACSVATAPDRVIVKTMGTDNIIQSYEWFYDVNAAYQARVGQIAEFKAISKSTDPAEASRERIELSAIRQTCRDLATKYNANSEKMNKSIFKGWSLPDTLDMKTCE